MENNMEENNINEELLIEYESIIRSSKIMLTKLKKAIEKRDNKSLLTASSAISRTKEKSMKLLGRIYLLSHNL